jgi:diadenosine tetraphosphate (Ap4A) HIT family hydrolase
VTTDAACPECAIARTGAAPGGFPVLRRGPFVVHARPEPVPVPGWLVVAPIRHVEQIDALLADEQRGLGPLLSEVAAAVRKETPCEKVYVSVFAEVLPHLHVHVIARPRDLPPEERGARLFASARKADEGERLALAARIHARLARPSIRGSWTAWRPILLSAVVGPGAGQISTRHYAKGFAFLAATLGLIAILLLRVMHEASARMPEDPSNLDPFFVFDLAAQIQHANAGFFGAITVGLTLLWVLSIVDAWRDQR